jgi:predicted negative regulator of RcsB-dependent stress response
MREAGLRARWPRWQVTFAVVSVIIAGGAAAVAKWPHAWWWLVVVTATAAAAMPPALAALSQVLQRRQEMGRAARAGLQGTTGTGGRKLPAAGAADLEARVHQMVLPIPYIHRDEEDTIRAHLHARRPVLLIGSSMVGKTKMATRVITEEFGSWPVAIPDSKTALTDLDAKDFTLQHSVIWLDDIDRLIGAGGITDGALRRLAAAGNIIVGTIRARAYDQLRPSDQLRPPEWDVLNIFEHIFISRSLTQNEQERLARAVPDPEIQDRIRAVGLGEYVGAAQQITEALKLGAAGTDLLGYALVLAAADWRRCGMTRPVPAATLVALAEPHLDHRVRARLTDQDAFKSGLDWACRQINPNVSLLQPAGTDSYVLYDYALDLISAQGKPVSDSSWGVIIANAGALELISVGYAAEVTYHRKETAAQAWRKAASSGHVNAAPLAAVALGALLMMQGEPQGARSALQEAIDSGHTEAAPLAAVALGALLTDQGDVQGAKDAYQKAIDSGHAKEAPWAALALGNLLRDQGDVQGARDAYQRAIDSRHAEAAPLAAVALGALLVNQGEEKAQEIRNALQMAVDSGHTDAAPRAAIALGALLHYQGDVEGARDAYQKAVDSGHTDAAPRAAIALGNLLRDQGDVQGAKASDGGPESVSTP